MTTDRLVIEAMARYLCRDYWRGDVARWAEFTGQAKDLLAIARAENPDIGEQHCDVGRIARVWSEGDDEPNDCFAVRDSSGDEWRRFAAGWMRIGGAVPISWEFVVSYSSPVTEILPPGEDTR